MPVDQGKGMTLSFKPLQNGAVYRSNNAGLSTQQKFDVSNPFRTGRYIVEGDWERSGRGSEAGFKPLQNGAVYRRWRLRQSASKRSRAGFKPLQNGAVYRRSQDYPSVGCDDSFKPLQNGAVYRRTPGRLSLWGARCTFQTPSERGGIS